MAKRLARHGWTPMHAVLAVVLVGLGIFLMKHVWADILYIARKDEESSHVFLVPIVAAWLVWVRRGRFRLCQPRGTWIGPILVAAGWVISEWGYYQAIQSFWHGGAIVVAVGCFLTVAGSDVLFRFLPAFAVLVFMIPVPGMIRQQVAIPLQTATAQVTQFLFEIMGIAVERSGNLLSINHQAVTIAEACNGMRMVFALVLVSYAFAFGEPLRNYVRFLILVASPLSAILCNVIRMVPTLWLYGYGAQLVQSLGIEPQDGQTIEQLGHTIATGFHDMAGWVMLGIAFLLLLAIIRLLQWALLPVTVYTLASD